MIMIVSSHFATHGGFAFDAADLSVSRFWVGFMAMGGKLGVDIFVLISGYFLITSDRKLPNIRRVWKFLGGGASLFHNFLCVV